MIELGRQARPHLYRLCEGAPAAAGRRGAALRARPSGSARRASCGRSTGAGARAAPREVAAAAPQAVAVCAAALLRRSGARADARRAAQRLLPGRTCRSPASSSAPSASTSGPPRPRSTRRSRRCSPLPAAAARARPREAGLPAPQIMQSSGGLTDAARAGAHAALTVLSGPAGGVAGRCCWPRWPASPTCSASTWAAPPATCA